MSREFDGKVALVTGGASGMGYATAQLLASRGAAVALLDINEGLKQAEELANKFHVKSTFVKVDVTSADQVQRAVALVVTWGKRLDYAVNAAGIFLSSGLVADIPPSQFTKVIDVNLNGAFYCMQEEIRSFRRLGIRGAIVNITSDSGVVAVPCFAAYVASKHALVGLTKAAALEYALEGIRVNAVAPGDVETPMMTQFSGDSGLTADNMGAKHPIGRIGKPKEIAELICFMLSDRAAFMIGSNVSIDGGLTAASYYHVDEEDLKGPSK